jgi:hypothetical protein
MITLLPLTPNQLLHETMATPKEAAEMLLSRTRLPGGKGKEASNTPQSRSTNHRGSGSNSVENSPAKGAKSPPKGAKIPTTSQKSPAKKQKSPAKKSKSTNKTQHPPLQIAHDTEDASNEGNDGEQRNKDNEASEHERDESDPDDENDPGHKPDYKGRVVSYTHPDSERPGHGIVGDYIQGQGYHVLFKYTDDLEPSECVDHCPLHWITDSLVDADTADAWNTAIEEARLHDSPQSSRQKKAAPLPTKRIRENVKRFEPESTTSNAKTRKAKKKQKTSLGDGVSNVHLQSTFRVRKMACFVTFCYW